MNFNHSDPLLTVVMPVYNVEEYLMESLESVIHQTCEDFEIIIVNDGSTDDSGSIVKEYANIDKRITVIEQENQGLSSARNRGLDIGCGKYIYFFDSDDLLVGHAFKSLIDLAEKEKCDVVGFSSVAINEKGIVKPIVGKKSFRQDEAITGEKLFLKMCRSGNYVVNVQKYFFKKQFLMFHKLRFDDGYFHEDESFTPISLCFAKRAASIAEPLLKKRFRTGSIMSAKRNMKNAEGWAKAAVQLIRFKKQHQLQSETIRYLDRRIYQLLRNSIKLYKNLENFEQLQKPLTDAILLSEIRSGSFTMYAYSKGYTVYMELINLFKKVFKTKNNL